MQRNKFLATLLVASLAAVPVATATWSVGGSYEPDTARDQTDQMMFLTPDVSPDQGVAKVYFNAVQHEFTTAFNPNVAALGSSVRSTPHTTFAAYLGVWKDCNKDGYIGMPEGVLIEYSSLLLTDLSVCPAGSEYNKDGWVYEFRPIGPNDLTSNETNFGARRAINDTKALVWGDRGLPDAIPGGSCAVNPTPAGTTSSTGGAYAYVDCIVPFVGTFDETVSPFAPMLIIGDEPQNSASPLNVRYPVHPWYNPYGNDGERTGALEDTTANNREKDHAFHVFDCDAAGTPVNDPTGGEIPQQVEDPIGFFGAINVTDEDGTLYVVPVPAADPNVNYRGSFYDSLNETEEGATEANKDGGCDNDDDNAMQNAGNAGIGIVEDYHGGVDTDKGRRETDVYFYYTPSNLGFVNYAALDDDQNACLFTLEDDTGFPEGCEDIMIVEGLDGTIVRDTPQFGGTGLVRTDAFLGDPIWYGLPNYLSPPQSISRATLQPEGGTIWSFYAYVGPATTVEAGADVLAATPEIYGSHACGATPSGGTNAGWDCDPTHWWNPQYDADSSAMPTQGAETDETCTGANGVQQPNCRDVGVRVGQAYNLRDIDCYDGQLVRGTPLYASLVLVSEAGPCQRPA